MPNLQKIIKVTQAQYDTLSQGGTVGTYTGLNSNFIYLVEDSSALNKNVYHINLDLSQNNSSTILFHLSQEQATYCRNKNEDVVIDLKDGATTHHLRRTKINGTGPHFKCEELDGYELSIIKASVDDQNDCTISISTKIFLEKDSYYGSSDQSAFRYAIGAGTVSSVRVQAGTGLSSSTDSAQTSTLNTTISVASGYKLPTTTEWDNKQNALTSQTAYSSKGSTTKVPQITTNSLGQVTSIVEKDIAFPTKVSQLQNDSGFLTDEANQTICVGNTAFGDSEDVELIAGDNVTITPNANAATITIASTNTWRPLGTGASDACAGNDSRLSNSRTPVAHASSETTYGVGTTSNYGHVKLATGDMNGASNADGVACSKNHTHSQYLTSITSSMVTSALGYTPPTTNTTYSNATTSAAGLMSSTDKSRVDTMWSVWESDGSGDTLVNKIQEVLSAFDSFNEGNTIVGLLSGKADSNHTHSQYLTSHQSLADYVKSSNGVAYSSVSTSYVGGVSTGPLSGSWDFVWRAEHRNGRDDGSSYIAEIMSAMTASGDLYWRKKYGGSSFTSFARIIDSNNIGSQSVNYATSAGTASSANSVAWSNVSGKPTFSFSNGVLTITTE